MLWSTPSRTTARRRRPVGTPAIADFLHRPAAALQKLANDLFATPKELVDQVKATMPAPGD
jgi:hypothetical protein